MFGNSFFSTTHCRYYAMARKACEPINLYPVNYEFEAQLCKWSKRRSPTELFRSLLYVANPKEWPVSEEEEKNGCGRRLFTVPTNLHRLARKFAKQRHQRKDMSWLRLLFSDNIHH